MGLVALSKMLDPAHVLSAILPELEKSTSNVSGSVPKADFNRVMRANITALTVADCEKVMAIPAVPFQFLSFLQISDTFCFAQVLKASGCDGPTVSLSLFKSSWTAPLPPPTPCAKDALAILGRAISSSGGAVLFVSL
jgi:hypothetical protein